MKKELNMQLDEHLDLLKDIANKSLNGISVKEILNLRQTYHLNEYEYCNLIKLRYIVPLGLLGLEYFISAEVERIVFFYIHHQIQQLPVERYDSDTKFHFSMVD